MTITPLWRWQELCLACGLPPVAGPDVSGISIDTRTLVAGDLFIALSGDPGPAFHSSGSAGRDGHEFVKAAIAAGAVGALVSRGTGFGRPVLQVNDTLKGLWDLGAAARARMTGQVAAITGSSGKTTARQWLQQLLEAQVLTHASTGSLNNHWGVPLSLARMDRNANFGVFEIGTNNPGEILPLARLVSPNVALVLNVLPAHLGRFEGLDAIRQEKLSIAGGLTDGGTLVVPQDLDLEWVPHTGEVTTFGLSPQADVAGEILNHTGPTRVRVRLEGREYDYVLGMGGEHRVLTSLAVIAVLAALGADLQKAMAGFEALVTPAGRGNLVVAGDASIIDDSYNANPVSVRYALQALAAMPGQRVAILGEMLELGEEGARLHQEIAPACVGLDGVITVGEGYANWQHDLGDRFWGHVPTAADIDLEALNQRLRPGAHLLVKGANKVFWTRGFVAALAASLGERV